MFNINLFYQALAQPNIIVMSDADAAAFLSTPTYTPVPFGTLQGVVLQLQCWVNITNTALDTTQPMYLRTLCQVTRDLIASFQGTTVDLSLPTVQTTLTSLVTAGLMTATERSTVLALGHNYPCGDVVATSDVASARQQISLGNQRLALVQWWQAQTTNVFAAIDQGVSSGTMPSHSDLVQIIQI
jgi:hypothetical protein